MKFRRSSTLRRALALSALALAVPAGAQAATVFDGDLETGDLSQYWLKQMCAPDRATVYSASSQAAWPKPVSGKYALRDPKVIEVILRHIEGRRPRRLLTPAGVVHFESKPQHGSPDMDVRPSCDCRTPPSTASTLGRRPGGITRSG